LRDARATQGTKCKPTAENDPFHYVTLAKSSMLFFAHFVGLCGIIVKSWRVPVNKMANTMPV
jgi:hypothetical protein